MHIPEQLYSLPLLKDVKTQQIELVTRWRGPDATGGSPTYSQPLYQIPKDRVAIVTAWGLFVDPNAGGGYCTAAGPYWLSPAGQTAYLGIQMGGFAVAGTTLHMIGGSCSIWLPPGGEVGIISTYNPTALSHNVSASISLLTIPRGAIALS